MSMTEITVELNQSSFNQKQGTLTEGEERLSTVDLLVVTWICSFYMEDIIYLLKNYLNEEVNCTEPSAPVSVLCLNPMRGNQLPF